MFFSVPLINELLFLRPIKKEKEKDTKEPVLNSRMEKLHFAFRMYDLDGDDKISKVLFFSRIYVFPTPFPDIGKVTKAIFIFRSRVKRTILFLATVTNFISSHCS